MRIHVRVVTFMKVIIGSIQCSATGVKTERIVMVTVNAQFGNEYNSGGNRKSTTKEVITNMYSDIWNTDNKGKKNSGSGTFNISKNDLRNHVIAKQINDDVTAKTKYGIPTTGKDIENHIKQITPENVMEILDVYKKEYGETLVDAINNEWGLDSKTKQAILQHLNQCVAPHLEKQSNCKIDGNFRQGKTGDCFFLAAVKAAASNPKGREILNETIKKNQDGSWTVKFKGADKEITVTPLDIVNNEKLSTGDLDVKILEIAAKKYFMLGIGTGSVALALDLLLGTDKKWKNLAATYTPLPGVDKLREIIKNPNNIVTGSISYVHKGFTDSNGKHHDPMHTYTVTDMDDKYVYLVDPHNSSETVKIDIDTFRQKFSIHYVTLD